MKACLHRHVELMHTDLDRPKESLRAVCLDCGELAELDTHVRRQGGPKVPPVGMPPTSCTVHDLEDNVCIICAEVFNMPTLPTFSSVTNATGPSPQTQLDGQMIAAFESRMTVRRGPLSEEDGYPSVRKLFLELKKLQEKGGKQHADRVLILTMLTYPDSGRVWPRSNRLKRCRQARSPFVEAPGYVNALSWVSAEVAGPEHSHPNAQCSHPPNETLPFGGLGYRPFGSNVVAPTASKPSTVKAIVGSGNTRTPKPHLALTDIVHSLATAALATSFTAVSRDDQERQLQPFDRTYGLIESIYVQVETMKEPLVWTSDSRADNGLRPHPPGRELSTYWSTFAVPTVGGKKTRIFVSAGKIEEKTWKQSCARFQQLYELHFGSGSKSFKKDRNTEKALSGRKREVPARKTTLAATSSPRLPVPRAYRARDPVDLEQHASVTSYISILRICSPTLLGFVVISASSRNRDPQMVNAERLPLTRQLKLTCTCRQHECVHVTEKVKERALKLLGESYSSFPMDLNPQAAVHLGSDLWSVIATTPAVRHKLAAVDRGRCLQCNSRRCNHVDVLAHFKSNKSVDDLHDVDPAAEVRWKDAWLTVGADGHFETGAASNAILVPGRLYDVLRNRTSETRRPAPDYVEPSHDSWLAANTREFHPLVKPETLANTECRNECECLETSTVAATAAIIGIGLKVAIIKIERVVM